MVDNTREIEKYYIAYVDLLGYKDFFENLSESEDVPVEKTDTTINILEDAK